jgi:hypothetical protein
MRGLTAVDDPMGGGYQVLLAARSWPGVIERIDPENDHSATVELDVRDFFARHWHDERVRTAAVTLGYQGFTAVTNPATGEAVHLVGVWIENPDPSAPPGHGGSHFLIRHSDATYEAADTPPPDQPGVELRATRCIAPSPFANEIGSWYFGGYDASTNIVANTAWMFRGDWTAWPVLSLTRPAPPDWQLEWNLAGTNWILETRLDLELSQSWHPVPGLSTRGHTRQTQSVADQDPSAYYRLRKP